MGRRKTGSVYDSRGVWYASLTINGRKTSARMPWASDKQKASERAREIQEILDVMGTGSSEALAVRFAKEAALASPDNVREIALLAKEFSSGKEQEVEPIVSGLESAGHDVTFGEVAELWTSGDLSRRFRQVRDIDQSSNRARLRDYILDIRHGGKKLKNVPIREFKRTHADEVLRQPGLENTMVAPVAQIVSRVLNLAVNPLALIPVSPLPRGWVPKAEEIQKSAFLFPSEVAQLLCCREVPLVRRVFYAFALNEGTRRGRLVPLEWAKLTETPGGRDKVMCRVPGTRNKPPVRWVLKNDTARMLRAWKALCPSEVLVFPAEAMPRYRRRRAGKPVDMSKYGEVVRADLRRAGVAREELFDSEDGYPRFKGHDLRAGYVIYSREAGASDHHISQRTGHTTTAMIDKYDQASAILKDSGCVELPPVDEMIPEIREVLADLDT